MCVLIPLYNRIPSVITKKGVLPLSCQDLATHFPPAITRSSCCPTFSPAKASDLAGLTYHIPPDKTPISYTEGTRLWAYDRAWVGSNSTCTDGSLIFCGKRAINIFMSLVEDRFVEQDESIIFCKGNESRVSKHWSERNLL